MREDWIECEIGDVFDVVTGNTPSKANPLLYGGNIPFIKPPEINNKEVEDASEFITEEGAKVARILPKYSVLITCIGNLGRVAMNSKFEVAFNQQINALKPNKFVYPKYIYYKAQSSNFRNQLEELSTAVTVSLVNKTNFSKVRFPLSPFPEQRAIVKKLESLFSSLDAGVADLKKAQQQLKIYRQAVLKKAFEGDLTKEWRLKNNDVQTSFDFLKSISAKRAIDIQKKSIYYKKISHQFEFKIDENIPSWSKAKLDNLIYIAARIGWRGLKKDEYTDFGPMFLSVHSLNYGKYVNYNEAYHITEDRYKESPEIQLLEGDVLLCKDGAGIGKLGVIKDLKSKATVNSSILVIRGLEILNQDFIFYLFSGPKLQTIVMDRITGSATPHLFQNDIKQFELSVPPYEEQQQIVKQIESRLSVCDSIEQNIKESLLKAEALRQSILKKAFEGNLLTAQELAECKLEKDYEPASVLLERIKAEQNKAAAKPSKKKVAEPLVVAETETPVVKISSDIHAGLIAKVIKIHEENPASIDNLSHIKCEKIAHLVEYHLQIPLGRQPVKDAAGPDDYPHLKKIEHRAKMANYFAIQKKDVGYSYSSANNSDKVIDKFQATLSDDKNKHLDDLIALFLKFDLEVSEIIATTYAGWNNLILNGNANPSDEEIVYESRENWSERKLKIARERFFKAIEWMRKNEIVPTGYGAVVPFPKKKK
ncbi:restriction endonuclease subunit S [Flavobacterium qiangtangense]|uniref:Restriction endonuclease subunit S n=1 Tax=Flavobacterium qiangtangense TaxID=1442595 RepID=A0ABW1PL90_9FLAO